MADKKCPNCGLWNSGVALMCDCGFDFTSGQMPGNVSRNRFASIDRAMRRGAVFGMLGALLAALPVSILKTWLMFSLGGCGPVLLSIPGFPIGLNKCGLVYIPEQGFLLYVTILLLAGGLSGMLATFVALKLTGRRSDVHKPMARSYLSWAAFAGGVLFDLVFVFILLYPGQ